MLKWLREQNPPCPIDEDACAAALQHDKCVEVQKWIHELKWCRVQSMCNLQQRMTCVYAAHKWVP